MIINFFFLKKKMLKCRWFSSSLISKFNFTGSLNSHFKFHEYVVNDDESDMRLDRYLHLRTNLPTSTIQKKIRKNEVFLP
jgi:hypothetical protein